MINIIIEEYEDCSKIKYLYHSVFSKNAEDYVDNKGITFIYLNIPINKIVPWQLTRSGSQIILIYTIGENFGMTRTDNL